MREEYIVINQLKEYITPMELTPLNIDSTLKFEISGFLRRVRTERNFLLKDVAKGTGLSIPYVSDIERGRTMPSVPTLQKFCNFYNMKIADLFVSIWM